MARQHDIDAIRRAARPLASLADTDSLVDAIGDARLVLLGEATHGTEEFYRLRADLTRRLIEGRGFDAVAVEADWPSALRASRWAQGEGSADTVDTALADFERFPRWMWRNTEVARWLGWLRSHNAQQPDATRRVGFFGLDLYSLRDSMEAVVRYLDGVDPEAAQRARARYACFDDLANEPQAYGHAVTFGLRPDCERGVLQQLTELCRRAADRLPLGDGLAGDELFYAQQNARVVHNAETYYRTMFGGRTDSWNVRDQHMAETLQLLDQHLARSRGRPARIVVWAHNSHIGDARATDAAERGQLNLGQLVRETARPGDAFLLGFTTHAGNVMAAADWDAPAERKTVVPSRPDSVERLLHDTGIERFVLPLRAADGALRRAFEGHLLERAIGVVYRPDTERWSHYFEAALARQFDAVVHLDTTCALRPLDGADAEAAEAPSTEAETYPTGL